MTARERYELLGPLATGGMAEVLLARTVGLQGFERLLAVKRVLPERAHDPELARMLIDEARNAAALAHHRIVQVLDIEMRDGALFYAMEYLHGQTLAALLARLPRPPLEASIAIAVAVAEGLHHAHTRPAQIVHRDVAPSNVMITYEGSIKLIDFGIAKAAGNLSRTVFGTFKGRLGYASPEQVRCESVDARTDVYSLAILLYELTTGRAAITAGNEQEMIERMSEARVPPPRTVDPSYPAELEAIVMKGLARDRTQRHATAEAFQHELEAFARRAGLHFTDLAMSRLMAKLFAEELAPWQRAKESGLTLEEHVVRQTLRDPPATAETRLERPPRAASAAARVPRPSRPSRRRRRRASLWIRVALVVVLVAAGYALTRYLLF